MPRPPLVRKATALATAALLGALSLAPAALAQGQPKKAATDDAVRMPSPKRSEEPPTIFIYFIVLVILGVVFGANMIPSKRGHQD